MEEELEASTMNVLVKTSVESVNMHFINIIYTKCILYIHTIYTLCVLYKVKVMETAHPWSFRRDRYCILRRYM